MKVSELREMLEDFDGDMEVHFEYNYGDHWRTTVAPKVTTVDEAEVVWSEYHRMPKIVERDYDEEDEHDEPETLQRVVVIG
jgi:predicted metal-binding protein